MTPPFNISAKPTLSLYFLSSMSMVKPSISKCVQIYFTINFNASSFRNPVRYFYLEKITE
jgi:hypothetical protein